jgi:hypothetical protein
LGQLSFFYLHRAVLKLNGAEVGCYYLPAMKWDSWPHLPSSSMLSIPSSLTPILPVPDSVGEEWISVGTFRAKEKITAKPQQVVDWTLAEKPRR